MPRKSQSPVIVCEFFSWKMFRRSGVFYADGRTGKVNLGKHSLAAKDHEQALINLKRLDQQMAVQCGLTASATPDPSAELTLYDGWALYLAHCERPAVMGGASPRTVKRYRPVRDKHLKYCAKIGISSWRQVNRSNVQSYGKWLDSQDYSPRSLYLELTLLKSIMLWLIEEGRIPTASRLKLELEKPQGTDTYCYSREQVAAMVHLCCAEPTLAWLGEVIVALACTGLRIGELASLRWTDVDLHSRTIRLTDERSSARRQALGTARRTKGRRDRTLPIHPDLYEILIAMNRHRDGLIFHGPRGGLLKPDTVRVIFIDEVLGPLKEKYPTPAGEIGFAHGRIHSFRHFFCSQSFLGGAAEADIREWLGHSDSKMVAHYRHLSAADSQRKMRQIDFLGRDARTVRVTG